MSAERHTLAKRTLADRFKGRLLLKGTEEKDDILLMKRKGYKGLRLRRQIIVDAGTPLSNDTTNSRWKYEGSMRITHVWSRKSALETAAAVINEDGLRDFKKLSPRRSFWKDLGSIFGGAGETVINAGGGPTSPLFPH